jgi:hypothetical protein
VCDHSKKQISGQNCDVAEEIEQPIQNIFKFEEDMFCLNITEVRKLVFVKAERKQLQN